MTEGKQLSRFTVRRIDEMPSGDTNRTRLGERNGERRALGMHALRTAQDLPPGVHLRACRGQSVFVARLGLRGERNRRGNSTNPRKRGAGRTDGKEGEEERARERHARSTLRERENKRVRCLLDTCTA